MTKSIKDKMDIPIIIKIMLLHPTDSTKSLVSELDISKSFYKNLKDKETFMGKQVIKGIENVLKTEEEIKNEK